MSTKERNQEEVDVLEQETFQHEIVNTKPYKKLYDYIVVA